MIESGTLDSITHQYLHAINQHAWALKHAAKVLFYSLATIQLTIMSLLSVIAGENLQQFFSKLLQFALTVGFFFLLVDKGSLWIPALIKGFVQYGAEAGARELTPSGILEQGLTIVSDLFQSVHEMGLVRHPFITLLSAILSIGMIMIFAFIAAELAIVLVKSYILILLSHLFFAFGALELTRPMSMNYFKAAVGLGLKLMTLYILLSVGDSIVHHWIGTLMADRHLDIQALLALYGSLIVFYLVSKNVPPWIAALSGIGGFRNYGDAAIASATTAGAVIANNIKHTAGGVKDKVGNGIAGGLRFAANASMSAFNKPDLSSSSQSALHKTGHAALQIAKSFTEEPPLASSLSTLSPRFNANFQPNTVSSKKENI